MPVKNVTTAGTRVALMTAGTEPVPASHFFRSVTIEIKPAMTGYIYIGFPAPGNSGALVSSTVYDTWLNLTTNPPVVAVTFEAAPGSFLDAAAIWLDSSVSGEGVTWFGEPA